MRGKIRVIGNAGEAFFCRWQGAAICCKPDDFATNVDTRKCTKRYRNRMQALHNHHLDKGSSGPEGAHHDQLRAGTQRGSSDPDAAISALLGHREFG